MPDFHPFDFNLKHSSKNSSLICSSLSAPYALVYSALQRVRVRRTPVRTSGLLSKQLRLPLELP